MNLFNLPPRLTKNNFKEYLEWHGFENGVMYSSPDELNKESLEALEAVIKLFEKDEEENYA